MNLNLNLDLIVELFLKNTLMSEEQPKSRFDSQVTLEELRARIQKFAEERDWDQVRPFFILLISLVPYSTKSTSCHGREGRRSEPVDG